MCKQKYNKASKPEKLSILENQRRPERSSIPLQAQIQEERCECVLNFQSQARLYDPNTTLSVLKNRPDSLRYRSRQHRSRLTVKYFIILLLTTICCVGGVMMVYFVTVVFVALVDVAIF